MLPLNVPVISEAHAANLIIQCHSQTLYMITNSLFLTLQLCSLQWQKAMIKDKTLVLSVCAYVFLSVQVSRWKHTLIKNDEMKRFMLLLACLKLTTLVAAPTVHLFLC